MTPLIEACSHPEVVKLLLDRGADIEAKDEVSHSDTCYMSMNASNHCI